MRLIAVAALALSLACSKGGACDAACEDQAPAESDLMTLLPPQEEDQRAAADLVAPKDLATCSADMGQAMCLGMCVSTRTDNDHCGECNARCFGKPEIRFTCCAGQCIGLAQDFRNCGACGAYCEPTKNTCCAGVCTPGLRCP
jgi:hypothetical protein